MKITRQQLRDAAEKSIISTGQVEPLYQFLQNQVDNHPRFNATQVLYYLGGLVAIAAMSLFMNLGWERFGGWGIFFIALFYAAVGLRLIRSLEIRGLPIPASIMAVFVVAVTPLAVYGLQQALEIWPETVEYRGYFRLIRWHWFYLELITLLIGAIMIWRYRYPFLMMPIAVTLWFLAIDLASILVEFPDFEFRAFVSLYFGLLMMLLAFWVDIRSRYTVDYAFWLYLFGAITFWCGLTLLEPGGEFSRFSYFLINLLMIFIGVLLTRRIFVILGGLGVCGYLGYLAYDVFRDSWLFPVVLTLSGFLIICIGILWHKKEQRIRAALQSFLPVGLRKLL